MAEKILKATHEATLKMGESFISCAVLEDGNRVLTQKDFTKIIGRASREGYFQVVTNQPPFLAAKNLEPFIFSKSGKVFNYPTI